MRCKTALRWGLAIAGLAVSGCYLAHPLDDDAPSEPPVFGSGPWLAYEVETGERSALRATQLDGLRTITVDEASGFLAGAWSPASPRLAIVVSDAGERAISIVRFDREGALVERRIPIGADIPRLLWSESGRYLAYYFDAGPVFVLDVEGSGEPMQIVTGRSPILRWSTSDVLALSLRGAEPYVAIARPDEGFAPRRVALPPSIHTASLDGESDAWSPDGRWLLFRAKDPSFLGPPGGNRLFVTSDRADAATLVSPAIIDRYPSASHARWSPDSRRVVYDDTELAPDGRTLTRGAYVNDRDGSRPMRLGPNLTPRIWWGPDALVAIESDARGTRGVLLEIGPLGLTRSELFTEPLGGGGVAIAPDGRRAVLARHGHPLSAISLWEVLGGDPRPLSMVPSAFIEDAQGWSPDGSRFVLVGHEERTWTAYELRAPEGEVRAIRAGVERFSRYVAGDPRPWSPGGEAYYLILEERGLAIRDVRSETTHELEASGVSMIGWQRSPSD